MAYATGFDLAGHIRHKMNAGELRRPQGERMLALIAEDPTHALDYRELYALALPDLPPVAYHCSPRQNRDSILRDGLRMARPEESAFWSFWEVAGQPEGVYVAPSGSIARHWGHDIELDVWQVLTEGLPWQVDPLNDECWVILANVPPTQLTLAGPWG
jgi:hypothetical protein